jgi:hypothetical protein
VLRLPVTEAAVGDYLALGRRTAGVRVLRRPAACRGGRPGRHGAQAGPGRRPALLLDYSANLLAHGLPDMAVRWSLDGRDAAPREPRKLIKLCPGCEAIVPLGVNECPECGHAFAEAPPREIDGLSPGAITATDHETVLRLKAIPGERADVRDRKRIAAARAYADGWVYRAATKLGIAIPRRERGALRPLPILTVASCEARR